MCEVLTKKIFLTTPFLLIFSSFLKMDSAVELGKLFDQHGTVTHSSSHSLQGNSFTVASPTPEKEV